ncbi:MAG: tryptophan 7-halogenase, partial [Gemmatimonadetes bacterium]|nr:tryptophan 7-halogenase [Gemmatimonadota bacterium]
MADLVLGDLARRYGLERVAPLAKFGTWRRAYPELVCGLKRGFSYFHHEAGRPFAPRHDRENELLVTASIEDALADTHWLRSDVDQFLANEAAAAGIPFLDRTEVSLSRTRDGWSLTGTRAAEEFDIRARFVIDASGEAQALPRALGIASRADGFHTNSRTVFAHFADVESWHDLMAAMGSAVGDHPFRCDHAALHHILDDGWMWQLGFVNGVMSAGFVLDAALHPPGTSASAEEEWNAFLRRYPSIAEQFEGARAVAPPGGLRKSGRLQRLADRIAGEDWVLLPYTAGFVDPMHSGGIAQTLCGIERLIQIMSEHWSKPTLPAALTQYAETVRREIMLIDALVSGGYLARRDFRLFAAYASTYFAAATTAEQRRVRGTQRDGAALLCADDPAFRQVVDTLHGELRALVAEGPVSDKRVAGFEDRVAQLIAPYNVAGLCDPSVRNMYRYTAI